MADNHFFPETQFRFQKFSFILCLCISVYLARTKARKAVVQVT
jgi:hypothetical protein